MKAKRRLWAPWRMEYIRQEAGQGCVFCAVMGKADDRGSLVLARQGHALVMMNRFPYNNGHLMVVPNAHKGSLDELTDEQYSGLCLLVRETENVLRRAFSPHGMNIGMNIGECAGAGFKDHLHFHLVPRWRGDTNFMPVIAETKVISEHILQTFDALWPQFEPLRSRKGECAI